MKVYSKKSAGALALLASAALVLSACSSAAEEPDTETPDTEAPTTPSEVVDQLKIAALLPQTGALGFLMPLVEAGIHLALEDINAAGGVLGNDVVLDGVYNEHDGSDTTVIDRSVDELLASEASFVLGAMSSSRTLHVIDKITGAGMVMGSPSNTAAELVGASPFYFRTAPPDTVQGAALGNKIVEDGVTDVAFLTFNDSYGTGLRDTIQETVEAAGVTVTYGGTGDGDEFPLDQQAYQSDVTRAIQSGAEAIVVVTFEQINQILPELINQGFDPANVYLVDGNANDMSGVVDEGAVVGMQGSIPGANADDAFKELLVAKYKEVTGNDLVSYTYAPEGYDLVVLTALAAERGGSADSATIKDNIHAVSGADGGTECDSFEACRDLLSDGEEIQFVGKSGIGALREGDPSAAWIGIYEYDETNQPQFQTAVRGEI